jgi:nucleotide-binding universal stress UspA family protein
LSGLRGPFRLLCRVRAASKASAPAAPGRDTRRELERLALTVPAENLDGVATAVGRPWSAICRAARFYDADVVVIGSHGHEALDRVLGTTAAKVVNHADRSVFIVRNPAW